MSEVHSPAMSCFNAGEDWHASKRVAIQRCGLMVHSYDLLVLQQVVLILIQYTAQSTVTAPLRRRKTEGDK